jgi:hypothetical protein
MARLYVCQKAAVGEGFNYLKNASNLQFSGVIANPSQSTAFWCYCDIVTTYSGTHSNFTIGRAGAEMK